MENANVLERRSDDWLYHHSSILGCFLISLGVCLAFLPNLPLEVGQSSSVKEITYSVINAMYSAIALCIQLLLLHFVRNREKFHTSQLVLWPKRCRECARVLGMLLKNVHSSDLHVHKKHWSTTLPRTTSTSSSSKNENSDTDGLKSQPTSATPVVNALSSPLVNDDTHSSTHHDFDSTNANEAERTKAHFIGLNLHSCLKNAFLFYSMLSLPGILILLVGQIVCLVQDKGRILSLSLKEVADLSLLTFVPLSMKFFRNYYDAVFVSTAMNNASLGLFLSVGVWICVYQVKGPISQLMESPYSKIGQPCDLNGTLGTVVDKSQTCMTPIYTQCLIIAVAILWQMCTSVTPRTALSPFLGQHHIETRHSQSVQSLLQFVVHHIKMFIMCVVLPRRLLKEDRGVFPQLGGTSGLQEYVYKTWTLSVVMSGGNLIIGLFIKWYQFIGVDLHETYLMESIDMALVFPLMLILVHERYIARKQQPREIYLKPISPVYLEGHDVLLLLCSCGCFCKCIFRVSAAIGLLFSDAYVGKYGISSPTYGIIYSLYSTLWIWLTAAFLLRVQRQGTKSIMEIKLSLAGLIYIMTVSFVHMVFFIFRRQGKNNVESDFFCLEAVKVMRVLFTPFSILFSLCQVIIAFESYRFTLREVLNKEAHLKCTDVSTGE